MKNLLKSLSTSGNPAKFIYIGEPVQKFDYEIATDANKENKKTVDTNDTKTSVEQKLNAVKVSIAEDLINAKGTAESNFLRIEKLYPEGMPSSTETAIKNVLEKYFAARQKAMDKLKKVGNKINKKENEIELEKQKINEFIGRHSPLSPEQQSTVKEWKNAVNSKEARVKKLQAKYFKVYTEINNLEQSAEKEMRQGLSSRLEINDLPNTDNTLLDNFSQKNDITNENPNNASENINNISNTQKEIDSFFEKQDNAGLIKYLQNKDPLGQKPDINIKDIASIKVKEIKNGKIWAMVTTWKPGKGPKINNKNINNTIEDVNEVILATLSGAHRRYAENSIAATNDLQKLLGTNEENIIDENGKSNLTREFQKRAGLTVDGWHGKGETQPALDNILAKVNEGMTQNAAFAAFKTERMEKEKTVTAKSRENTKKIEERKEAEEVLYTNKLAEYTKEFGEPSTINISGFGEYKNYTVEKYGNIPKGIPAGISFTLNVGKKPYRVLKNHFVFPKRTISKNTKTEKEFREAVESERKDTEKSTKNIEKEKNKSKENIDRSDFFNMKEKMVSNDMDMPDGDWDAIKKYTVKDLKDGVAYAVRNENGNYKYGKVYDEISDIIGSVDIGDLNKWLRGTDGKDFLSKDDSYTLLDYLNEKAGTKNLDL